VAIHFLMVGTGLLSKEIGPPAMFGAPRENNRQKFYDYMHESKDIFVVTWSPRVKEWKEFLTDYPDFAEKFVHYEMPYAISNVYHLYDHQTNSEKLGLTDSRRNKLIILKGGKCEN
jgi:hypothetical protein